jgi:hypothetical protein
MTPQGFDWVVLVYFVGFFFASASMDKLIITRFLYKNLYKRRGREFAFCSYLPVRGAC